MNENTAILRNSVLTGVSILLVTILVFLFSPSMMVIKVVSDIFPLVLSAACAAIAYRIFRRQERTRLGSRIWGYYR